MKNRGVLRFFLKGRVSDLCWNLEFYFIFYFLLLIKDWKNRKEFGLMEELFTVFRLDEMINS